MWVDPLFVDPSTGDFRISTGSPCVDAANGAIAPETDSYGRVRMDVLSVRDKGTPAANGAVPDIGIYEVAGDGHIPSPDLTVTAITCPKALTVGETAEIAWTMENVGDEPATGIWRDEIELVAPNGQVFSMDTVVTQSKIMPDATENFKAVVTIPAAPGGIVQVRVTANNMRGRFDTWRIDSCRADGRNGRSPYACG